LTLNYPNIDKPSLLHLSIENFIDNFCFKYKLYTNNVLYYYYLYQVMSHSSHPTPAVHGFLMLGTHNLYLCHLPMYHMPAHSYQTILEAEIEESAMKNYVKIKKETPAKPLIILNQSSMILEELVNSNSFNGPIHFANENGDPEGGPIGQTTVNIKKVLLFKQLNKDSPDYPENLEYYLFGTNPDWHLSHFLSKAPNFEQELDISVSGNLSDNEESQIIKILIPSVNEKSSQHITQDPLTKREYTITTENGEKFQIAITNRFWINNKILNQHM
jgi:hypothetical protein